VSKLSWIRLGLSFDIHANNKKTATKWPSVGKEIKKNPNKSTTIAQGRGQRGGE
jgi:hypothetical protein